ncbi:MBL fold metallo-hydrolase [bacterium]|nr:MBL fold metallo-hydrolase [bacterium]
MNMSENPLKIHGLTVGLIETNCYLLEHVSRQTALCVDPGGDAEKILAFCKKQHISIDRILLTHGHYDHIGAVNALVDLLGIPVYIHFEDVEMATNPDLNLSRFIMAPYQIDSYLHYYESSGMIRFFDHSIQVIHTPGHTPGSICLLWNQKLISGDTLFRNSIGRTDFPGSDPELLIRSIKSELMGLDDGIEVYPGHGMNTTIGHERRRNPFLAPGIDNGV